MTKTDQWFASHAPGTSSQVVLVSSTSEWEAALDLVMIDLVDFPFVGIDCEWLSSDTVADQALQAVTEAHHFSTLIDNITKRRVCLLQLATIRATCVLVRLCLFEKLPESLRHLLGNEQVWKVGVNVEADKRQLKRSWVVDLESWIDLRNVFADCESVGGDVSQKSAARLGLNGLSERLFGRVACENKVALATSNWAAVQLSAEQTAYAAGDAQMGIDCFIAMCNTVWPEARGQLRAADILHRFESHKCRPVVPTTEKTRQRRAKKTPSDPVGQAVREQLSEKAKKIPQLSRNKLYDNIQLFAPDGTLVGLIGRKKAAWYLTRGLVVEKAACVEELVSGY